MLVGVFLFDEYLNINKYLESFFYASSYLYIPALIYFEICFALIDVAFSWNAKCEANLDLLNLQFLRNFR